MRTMYNKILMLLFILVIPCNNPSKDTVFSITKIEQGKDGKTLFLVDSEGTEYTTVISIPNGNYVEVEVGDRLKLEIKEILGDMEPIIVLSRTVEVLD